MSFQPLRLIIKPEFLKKGHICLFSFNSNARSQANPKQGSVVATSLFVAHKPQTASQFAYAEELRPDTPSAFYGGSFAPESTLLSSQPGDCRRNTSGRSTILRETRVECSVAPNFLENARFVFKTPGLNTSQLIINQDRSKSTPNF